MESSYHVFTLARSLVTVTHQPSEAVNALAGLTGIEPTKDLNHLIRLTQEKWLRPAGTERDELPLLYTENASKIVNLCRQIGLCSEVRPKTKKFTYALILGSEAAGMLERITFLEKLIANQQIIVDELVLLTGQRALGIANPLEHDFIKQYFKDTANLTTETEIAKAFLAAPNLFPHLKKIKLTYTDSASDPDDTRPRTDNTIQDWLATEPKPGACIAISSAPFIIYQDLTLRTALPESFTLETCGPIDTTVDQRTLVSLYLDSLARALFQYAEWLAVKGH